MKKLLGLVLGFFAISAQAQDYYSLLGVKPTATYQEIKAAFRALAIENHPDSHPDATPAELEGWNSKMGALSDAWAVLSDENRRHEYDMQRLNRRQLPAVAAPPPASSNSHWRSDADLVCRGPLTSILGGRFQTAMEPYFGGTTRMEVSVVNPGGVRSVLKGPVDRVPNSPFKFRIFTNRFSRTAYQDVLFNEVERVRVLP